MRDKNGRFIKSHSVPLDWIKKLIVPKHTIPHSEETKEKISLANRGKRKGVDNSNWKGGISTIARILRSSREYKQWRKKCFERDKYTCQKCGFNGNKGYITVHHIKSVHKNINLIFNMKNGITLCEKCHSKTDNYKGRARK